MACGKIIFTQEQISFLLSPRAKELTPVQAERVKPDEAYERFKEIRFGWQEGKPYCPHCGHERVYEHSNRNTFKCAKCGKHFSVTTRTVFASRKLPYGTILHALALRIHDPRNAHQTSLILGVNYRTSVSLAKTFKLFGNAPALKPSENRWPYANRDREEGATLVDRVNAALPYSLPEQVRADAAQDIILGVLEGHIREDDLAREIQSFIKSHYRRMEWRFDTLSLDAPVPGTEDMRWDEILDSGRPHL